MENKKAQRHKLPLRPCRDVIFENVEERNVFHKNTFLFIIGQIQEKCQYGRVIFLSIIIPQRLDKSRIPKQSRFLILHLASPKYNFAPKKCII